MKKLPLFVALVAICSLCLQTGQAQGWNFVKVFPDTIFAVGGSQMNNCMTVDHQGRLWLASYTTVSDSIMRTGGTYITVGEVLVYNPNGTQASFSPMKVLNGGSVHDTLNAASLGVSSSAGYGMTTGKDGSIYLVKPSRFIYKLNPATGAVLQKKQDPIPGYASSIASVAVDDAGEAFLVGVITQPGPIALSADFNSVLVNIDTSAWGGVARSIAVSHDGKDVYIPYFAGAPGSPCVYHYHGNSGTLGTYAFADTLFRNMSVESMAWDPKTGYLWCGSGGPVTDASLAPWSPLTWYGFDMTNPHSPVIKDSLKWSIAGSLMSADSSTRTAIDDRGIAFSPSGDTVYVGMFNTSVRPVQMFTRKTSAVETLPNSGIVTTYTLEQNFPNPFNPSTEIRFTIAKPGLTTLRVYDMLGRVVQTLVNQDLQTGAYKSTFDATRLTSGTYIYELRSGEARMTKKMILLK